MSGHRRDQADPEAEFDPRDRPPDEVDGEDASERESDPAPTPTEGEREADASAEPPAVDGLKQEIESLTGELEELRDRHLRLAAEFDNFRKRTVRERAQQARRAQGDIVRELLESLDDLARVTREAAGTDDAAALLEGVQLVERKLHRTLERHGLTPVESVGRPFDPEVHDALSTVPTTDPEQDGVIAQELAKGYLFEDMLLRPALVEVKKYEGGKGADDAGPDGAGDET